jgi:signal transduction histidine kinase
MAIIVTMSVMKERQLSPQVEIQRIDLLFTNKIMLLVVAFIITIFVYSYLYTQKIPYIDLWLGYGCAILALRFLLIKYYHKKLSADLAFKVKIEWIYSTLLIFTGLQWGLTSFLFLDHLSGLGVLILLLMVYGVLFGGLTASTSSMRASISFTLAVILPYMLYGFKQANFEGFLIAAATLPFMMVLLKSARINFQLLIDSLEAMVLEQQLQEERINSLHNAKLANIGEISAGVAHEINNPLTVITIGLTKIRRATAPNSSDSAIDIQSTLDLMQDMVARIVKLIEKFKGFAHKDTEDILVKTSITEIVDDALTMTKRKIDSTGIKLIKELTCDPPKVVLVHKNIISQVLINLINNACDALEGDTAPYIKIVDQLNKDGGVTLSIIDSGNIPNSLDRERLFEPFYTSKVVGKGTGLGLSLARQIMHQHKGNIILDQNFPTTKFDLIFPAPTV